MLNLFYDKDIPSRGSLNHSLNPGIQRLYTYIDGVLKSYWGHSAYRLENNHILIQVLRTLSQKLDTPWDEVYANIDARHPYVSRHFGFTSTISHGKHHEKTFYGGVNTKEYILAEEIQEVFPFDSPYTWYGTCPLKILYHPCTDFNFLLPTGREMPYNNSFTVMQVDVRLLALQYHRWKILELRHYRDKAILSPNIFLVTRVLPMLYPQWLDMVIVNRFFFDVNDNINIRKLPVSFPDIGLRIKPMVESLNRTLKHKAHDYLYVLNSIKVPTAGDARQCLRLPKINQTRQSRWLYWLSRFKYIDAILRFGGTKGFKVNKQLITALKIQSRSIFEDNTYKDFPELEDFLFMVREL